LESVIYITEKAGNKERLEWDLFHLSHHCSYKALAKDKGKDKTVPTPTIQRLFDLAGERCILISPSEPIPSIDTIQPPHRQAAAYYKEVAQKSGSASNFMVTMEWPTKETPKPITVKTSVFRFTVRINSTIFGGSSAVVEKPSPRLG